jgi:hypothetical protein
MQKNKGSGSSNYPHLEKIVLFSSVSESSNLPRETYKDILVVRASSLFFAWESLQLIKMEICDCYIGKVLFPYYLLISSFFSFLCMFVTEPRVIHHVLIPMYITKKYEKFNKCIYVLFNFTPPTYPSFLPLLYTCIQASFACWY